MNLFPRCLLVRRDLVTVLLLLSLATACASDIAPDAEVVWDTDGDQISDAVELESHNSVLYGFRIDVWDPNPSRAFGTRSNGTLFQGLNLPDEGTGTTRYVHQFGSDLADTDDWGTLSLLNVIESVARAYRNTQRTCHPEIVFLVRELLPRPQINDLSLQTGGYWSDHSEHENGLDVDVRYLRISGETGLDLAIQTERAFFDLESTLELLQCFLDDARVIQILYDAEFTQIFPGEGETKLINRHSIGDHTDHFHVRIADPDGANN